MTREKIEALIAEFEQEEAEALSRAENPEGDCVNSSDYNYGLTDAFNYCIDAIKGKAGFYD